MEKEIREVGWVCSFIVHSLNIYYVPGTVLDTRFEVVNKKIKISLFMQPMFSLQDSTKQQIN